MKKHETVVRQIDDRCNSNVSLRWKMRQVRPQLLVVRGSGSARFELIEVGASNQNVCSEVISVWVFDFQFRHSSYPPRLETSHHVIHKRMVPFRAAPIINPDLETPADFCSDLLYRLVEGFRGFKLIWGLRFTFCSSEFWVWCLVLGFRRRFCCSGFEIRVRWLKFRVGV